MLRPRIYVDTSVIGGCFDEEFEEYSNQLFDEFVSGRKIVIVSDVALLELEGAPDNVRGVLADVPSENIEYVSLNEVLFSLPIPI